MLRKEFRLKSFGGFIRNCFAVALLVLAFSSNSVGQEVLTIDSAIGLALQNNYDILLAKNDAEIAKLANTPGNAGMLPKISATLTDNFSLTNLNQKLSTGTETNKSNVTGNTINPSLNISWTLFDGLKMFATKGKLKRLQQISELNVKDTLQTMIAQVIEAYYDVVSAQQQLRSINEAIALFEETAKLAQKQFEVGMSSKVVLLQAKVDLNANKSAALTQRKLINQKKAILNLLLVRPADLDFTTLDTIEFNADPKLLAPNEIDAKNFQTQVAAKNIEVAKFVKKEAYSQMLPYLILGGATSNLGYGFARTENSAGFSLYNQTYGPSIGFTLGIPIFNGLVYLNQTKAASISILNSQYKFQKISMLNKLNYYNALKDFETAKEALKLEEDNIILAKENSFIAFERFRLVQSTAIELRQAQQSYVDAMTRLVTARFNAKTAETELLRIQGDLVK
ncbi:MAG: TolC family protein [Bacteroidota bacterium]|nr:TolC family protein [Bacteroidota bacterium]